MNTLSTIWIFFYSYISTIDGLTPDSAFVNNLMDEALRVVEGKQETFNFGRVGSYARDLRVRCVHCKIHLANLLHSFASMEIATVI